jgi:hypothetical protein
MTLTTGNTDRPRDPLVAVKALDVAWLGSWLARAARS